MGVVAPESFRRQNKIIVRSMLLVCGLAIVWNAWHGRLDMLTPWLACALAWYLLLVQEQLLKAKDTQIDSMIGLIEAQRDLINTLDKEQYDDAESAVGRNSGADTGATD